MKRGVLSVKRRSDRIIWVKVALSGEIINTIELTDIPGHGDIVGGGGFNDHCGKNNSGKEEAIGTYGVGESNEGGDNCVAFAMSHTMRVVNTYFEKAERHKITYKSRAPESQIAYILYRSSDKSNSKTAKFSWVKV